MEKFVNDVCAKLSLKLNANDLITVRQVMFTSLKYYDVIEKSTEVATYTDQLPRELMVYLAARKIEGLSDSTIKAYKRVLEHLLRYCNKPMSEIKTEDIRLYLYEIKVHNNLDNRTLDTKRNYINTFFKWCADNEYITRNPCAPIPSFKYEKKLKEELSDIELERLRMACKNDFEKAMLEVLFPTACRVNELVNIKLSDIDFERHEVKIIQGKGNKSRITFLNAKAILAIKQYIAGRDYDTVYLFESSRKPHHQLTTRHIEKTCKELGERTGVRLHPHKIRRTTATTLWRKGMPVEEIKLVLGHEDISTTLIYTNVDRETVKHDHLKFI